jgi:Zn-dependent peptidase ImmA (M78 family)
MSDYSKFKTPFLGNSEIKKKAEEFRNEFWDNLIPIDIEKIMEVKLGIDIIPVPNLMNVCDIDALITSDWKSIYVDNDRYFKNTNRFRFSLAHELGHFVLHKEVYKSFKIKSTKDFRNLINKIPQREYNHIETQANKFASYFIIPRKNLYLEKEKIISSEPTIRRMLERREIDIETLDSHISIPLSKVFCVSEEAIEIALGDIRP